MASKDFTIVSCDRPGCDSSVTIGRSDYLPRGWAKIMASHIGHPPGGDDVLFIQAIKPGGGWGEVTICRQCATEIRDAWLRTGGPHFIVSSDFEFPADFDIRAGGFILADGERVDTSDIPEVGDDFWSRARLTIPGLEEARDAIDSLLHEVAGDSLYLAREAEAAIDRAFGAIGRKPRGDGRDDPDEDDGPGPLQEYEIQRRVQLTPVTADLLRWFAEKIEGKDREDFVSVPAGMIDVWLRVFGFGVIPKSSAPRALRELTGLPMAGDDYRPASFVATNEDGSVDRPEPPEEVETHTVTLENAPGVRRAGRTVGPERGDPAIIPSNFHVDETPGADPFDMPSVPDQEDDDGAD